MSSHQIVVGEDLIVIGLCVLLIWRNESLLKVFFSKLKVVVSFKINLEK